MKNKLIAYLIISGIIVYYISKQGILQLNKEMILLIIFGLISGYLINKYIK